MINSRKLSIKAVVTLEVRVENLYDAEAAVDIETDGGIKEKYRCGGYCGTQKRYASD